ncbi:MAG: NADH-quinone oxidoreductase subunit M [Candidatus Hydrogenedentes bacterium]|nr:NADH-quinone oxidoreductase subunit M [Candidatus Hydrogenedentota bacterium]
MILVWILVLPAAGGLAAYFAAGSNWRVARAILAASMAAPLLLLVWLWGRHSGFSDASRGTEWIGQFTIAWIPQRGIQFALAMDGLALLLSLLTCLVGLVVALSLNGSHKLPGAYALLLALLTTAMLGVFLASDLFLFFVSYEVMLLPAYALLIGWGHGDTRRAATRFFLFTQAGGLLMLVAILGLHVAHYQATGVQTFLYRELSNTPLSPQVSLLFLTGFILAFAVKLPLVPFHTWQPDTYASASAETTILFSAVMAKTAGYGLLRFAVPMFPGAAETAAPGVMALGVLTILYASWLAYGQTDLKRIVAYSSAGHLGYIVLGAFAMNDIGTRGAIVQMVCHGLSVTGLFIAVDVIERRTGTRDIEQLGGLWKISPRFGSLALILALATLGLPGLGNFVGEFLILTGTYQHHPLGAAIAAFGAVLAAAYSLRIVQKVFFGPPKEVTETSDSAAFPMTICAVLIAALVWIGFFPQPLLDAARTVRADRNEALVASAGEQQ